MRIIDISLTISPQMTIWPSHKPIQIAQEKSMDCGDACNQTRLSFDTHTGTHVDAPFHFKKDGQTIDQLPLELFCGGALVVEIPETESKITVDILERLHLPKKISRLLFKTRNSRLWSNPRHAFQSDYVYLDEQCVDWLSKRGAQLVGIDYLSIEKFRGRQACAHQRLFDAGIVVVEGLNLNAVNGGEYEFICLPLKIENGDGSPARAALLEK